MKFIGFVSTGLLIAFAAATAHSQPNHQLTDPPPSNADAFPTFSPLGDKVAFARAPFGSPFLPTIFVANTATGATDSLVTGLPSGWNPNGGMEWSPDGRRIAFMAPNSNGPGDAVWIADVPSSGIPRILGFTDVGNDVFRAIASDGTVFDVGVNNAPCTPNVSSVVLGNLFGGPPISPVVQAAGSNGTVFATLENGDVWYWCTFSNQGIYAGNILSAAGVSAVGASTPQVQNHLASARPNPFNPVVRIPYSVASQGKVSVRVFDASGQLVRTLEETNRGSGSYTANWDGHTDRGAPAASGTYFCQVHFADGSQQTRKVTLAR